MKINEMPAVLIGAPIRDMERVLQRYLDAILGLDYPKKRIALMWIVNDSEDESLKMLQDFKKEYEKKYKRIEIAEIQWNAPKDAKIAEVRYGAGDQWGAVDSMGRGKNILKESILEDEDYLFYVEGDVILTRDCLKKLLNDDKKIVGALVKTGDAPNAFNVLRFDSLFNCYTRDSFMIPEEISLVDFVSGPVLFHRSILRKIEFNKMQSGEDSAAMNICRREKIDVWLDPRVKLEHLYSVR